MVSFNGWPMSERFSVSGEFGGEPALGTEIFGIGVEDWITAETPFESETGGAFGEEVTIVYIVL